MKILRFIVLSVILVSSCHRNTLKVLQEAETYMDNTPDSAYTILKRINIKEIDSKWMQAKYALLMSQALDKNYIDETDPSLVKVAVDYYESHGTVRERFLSLYYYGRVLYNIGEYAQAMLEYTKAEQLLQNLEDQYLSGLLYTQMGDIYRLYYCYEKGLECYKRAYTNYLSCNKEYHSAYALLDIGLMHWGNKDLSEAERYMNQALQEAKKLSYKTLMQTSMSDLISFYAQLHEYAKAKRVMMELLQNGMPYVRHHNILQAIAKIYANDKNRDSSYYFMNEAYSSLRTKEDTISWNYDKGYVERVFGNNELAYKQLSKAINAQTDIIRDKLNHNILSAKMDYYKEQIVLLDYKRKVEKMRLFVSLFVVIVTISLFALYLAFRIKRKNEEIGNYLGVADELKSSISAKDVDKASLNTNNQYLGEMKQQIEELFSEQNKLLSDFLDTYYYEMNEINENKGLVYQDLNRIIRKFKSSSIEREKLEIIVDKYKNNVMHRIREECPNLKEIDYLILALGYAGFSAKAISLLTGENARKVYNVRYRIKKTILRTNVTDIEYN